MRREAAKPKSRSTPHKAGSRKAVKNQQGSKRIFKVQSGVWAPLRSGVYKIRLNVQKIGHVTTYTFIFRDCINLV